MRDQRPAETYLADAGFDEAEKHLGDRRLARAALADDAERFTGVEREGDVVEQRRMSWPGCQRDACDVQPAVRPGQACARRHLAGGVEKGLKRTPAALCPRDLWPAPDNLFDRRQRAAKQNRGGDHRARRDLGPKDEPGAESEDQRLQGKAEGAREGLERTGPVNRPHRLPQRP